MKKKLFIHHHIFKNAGTSLDRTLKEVFGDAMYFYDTNNKGGVVTNDMLFDFVKNNIEQETACLSSHQVCLSSHELKGLEIIKFVLLREPIRRFFSMYNYHKRISPTNKLDYLAKEVTFKEFMKWIIKNSKVVSSNFQTNFCSKTITNKRTITHTDLLIAKENLTSSDGVGIVERYEESLTLFNKILEKHKVTGIIKKYQENKSKQLTDTIGYIEDQLGTELIRQLKNMNELDNELYIYANTLLDRKLIEQNRK